MFMVWSFPTFLRILPYVTGLILGWSLLSMNFLMIYMVKTVTFLIKSMIDIAKEKLAVLVHLPMLLLVAYMII
jgi:hypothetical protein